MDAEIDRRPAKRPRTSKSYASILEPARRLVRSPLETIGSIAESLGYRAEDTPVYLSGEEREKQLRVLRLRGAKTYDEWRAAALELDKLEGGNDWKARDDSDEYDVALLKARLERLNSALRRRDVQYMRFEVRTALTRDLGGLGNVRLYQHSRIGTKALIERYIETVIETIDTVVNETGSGFGDGGDANSMYEQLKKTRQAFGRSALLLSGGGTLGMNHIGVIKALFEAGLLPRIISGASAGSIVCAVLCSKTDAEIPDVLHEFCRGDLDVFEKDGAPESLFQKATRFFTKGAIYDISNLKRVMESLLGTMTFLEAYNRTHRILNICVSNAGLYEMPRLLNYVTAPDVTIASAVAASCSVPLVFSAADLFAKDQKTGEIKHWDESPSKWIDGSVDNDLPMTRLAEMLNVNHFIVSQVNPHVVPFLAKEGDEIASEAYQSTSRLAPGPSWMTTMANLAKAEALHRMHVFAELGIFPNTMTKIRSVVGQRYSGDITIMPEISYTQFPHILSNPTEDFMVQATFNGERATWPKLSRIRNHLSVELKLDWAVMKMLVKLSFSQSQVDLRMNAFSRSTNGPRSERGRSRRGSKASHKSARSAIVPRKIPGRQAIHRPIKSMLDPPSIFPVVPPMQVPNQSKDAPDYFSSTDEARSPRSSSPSPLTDDGYDSSDDGMSDTSVSPGPTPRPELYPSTRHLFPSASQPATPSIASKAFLSDNSPTSTRSPTPAPKPPGLTMTPSSEPPPPHVPSSPEMRYKRLFHGRFSPLPTIRSQTATPEPKEPNDDDSNSEPGIFRRRSKLGLMNLDISGTRGMMRRKKRSMSTGIPGLKPP